MELWELPADELWSLLSEFAVQQPELNPHNQLLLNSFLKHAPAECRETSYSQALQENRPFAALWAELRCLGLRAPLKHREFVPHLNRLARYNQERPALQSLSSQAELGDDDAVLALLRASLECPEELFASLFFTLKGLRNDLGRYEVFLKLYEDSPAFQDRLQTLRETFLPELADLELTLAENVPAPRPRLKPPSKPPPPRWSLREIRGIGRITLFSSPLQVFETGLETLRKHPDGFFYTTYRSIQGGYAGSGASRPIHCCRLADDFSYLVLQCAGALWDLLSLDGQLLATIPAGNWTCFTTSHTSRLPLIGGSDGIYEVNRDQLRQIHGQSVAVFSQLPHKLMTIEPDGTVHVYKKKWRLPPGPPVQISPDGQHLARLHEGKIELYKSATGKQSAFAAPEERELAFTPDSKTIVTIRPQGLTHWTFDGIPLAQFSEREVTAQPLPVTPPQVTRQQMAHHDRFFEGLSD